MRRSTVAYGAVMSGDCPERGTTGREPVTEFTFFVDADLYMMNGGELAACEDDLHAAGVYGADIPTEFGVDLGERIPVRVRGTARGLRFYARLLGLRDPLQLEELSRVVAAAEARMVRDV